MNSDYNNVRMMSDLVGCLYNIISQVAQVEDCQISWKSISGSRFPIGAVQRRKIPKIQDYYGSGWVGLVYLNLTE